jgi:hypothetical protein
MLPFASARFEVARFADAVVSASRRPRGAEQADASPLAGPARRGSASGAPLAALAGGALASRFYAWRGASGARYVASVQRTDDDSWLEIEGAVALLVEVAPDGARRLLDVEPAPSPARRQALKAQAARVGARREIHLHLLADTPSARVAAAIDLLSAGAL